MLAGDSGGNRFNHGESQQSQPPSRPGTSSGKAETELSLTRDLAHGRNLGLGQCHERSRDMQRKLVRDRAHSLGRTGPVSPLSPVWPGLGGRGAAAQVSVNLVTTSNITFLPRIGTAPPGPGPLQSTWPGSWSLPAQPSNMFCAATTSSGFYHHEILFNTCPVPGWLLAAYVTPSHCNSS